MTAAHVVLALASGAALGLPLFAVAVFVARPFARAAVRFRIYAVAFAAAALYGPLALVLSIVHPIALPASRIGTAFDLRVGSIAPQAAIDIGAIVALVLLADLVFDFVRLLRIKAGSLIDADQPLQTRGAAVAASSRVRTPTAIGYLHPRIVVPHDLAARVSPSELRAVVAHEAAHLERYDDWTKALQIAIVRLAWFSPALWALSARLDLERELASDERVLAVAVDSRAYAACLVRLASDVRHPPLAPAAWTARSQVSLRVERLLRPERPAHPLRAAVALATLAVTLVGAAIGAAALVPSIPEVAATPPTTAPRVAQVALVRPMLALPRHAAPKPKAVAVQVRAAQRIRAAATPAPIGREKPSVTPRSLSPAKAAAPVVNHSTAELASVLPSAPCRKCVMLRRPVTDGPAIHPTVPRPSAGGASTAVATGDLTDEAGLGLGLPWDRDTLRSSVGKSLVELLPWGR